VIDGLKPYTAMKDSGVPWLGGVPKHWAIVALRHRYTQCLGKMLDSKRIRGEHSVSYLRNVDVQWDQINTVDLPVMDIAPAEYGRYLVQPGDLLVCEGGEVGRAAVWKGSLALCGYQKALHRLRPISPELDNPRFLMFVMMAASAAGAFYDGHESTIAHLTGDKLRMHRFPFPDRIEQATIVRIIDHADRLIRRYIAARRKLIKSFEQQKQAVIQQAASRGLDPNVRLKPSGIGWLGDVPEHWEVVRNGRLFVQRNETGFGELPILEVSLRTGVRVRQFENGARKQVMVDREKYKRAVNGDIAYNMMRMWQGAVGVAPVDGLISPAYVVASPLPGVEVRYFANLFRTPAYMGEVNDHSRGIVKDRNRLYWEDFKQIFSPCPPQSEQKAIADFVDSVSASTAAIVGQVDREIGLLQEYRTRLIADVVTGKLDVRAAAAALPDALEDAEAVDTTEEVDSEDEASDEDIEPDEAAA
jgi:type I restriction enzyme S subunit